VGVLGAKGKVGATIVQAVEAEDDSRSVRLSTRGLR